MKSNLFLAPASAASLLLLTATPGFAAFHLTANSTSAQTLASGSGIIDAGVTLTVSGAAVAINVTGSSTITNNGTINQTGNGRAIRDNTGGLTLSVTNNSGALIQTADADVIQMNKANSNVAFDNYGSLVSLNASAGGAQAIDFNAITTGSNTLNNYSTGTITAYEADAVRPGVNGVVTNAGTIKSITTTGSSSDGIDCQTNTGVSITNSGSGLIEGGRHGITGGNTTTGVYAMSITNNIGTTIQGDNGSGINIDGINGSELVTVINHGTITGDGITGDGDGVDVDGLVNLTNSGTIKSLNAYNATSVETSEGVTVGGGTITNTGTIEGDVASGNTQAVGRGITIAGVDKDSNDNPIPVQAMYGTTVITNSGLIKGQSDSGIAFTSALASGFTVTITNQAGGIIEGGGFTVAALQTGADNDTVNNAGSIIADASGKAIDLGAGDDTLNITGGTASITGDISGGTGTNTLDIAPGTGNTFTYAGAISNFSSVTVENGSVHLSGASTYTGDTKVLGGTLILSGAGLLGSGNLNVAHGATLDLTGISGVTFTLSGTQTLNVGGIIDATGKTLIANGQVNPGASPGLMTVLGNFTLASTAQLNIEVAGLNRGVSYDALNVSGLLTLAGSISVTSTYTFGQGDTLDLLDFGSLDASGFNPATQFILPTLGAGLSWNTSNLTTDGTIRVVPEPSTWGLLLGGGLGLFLVARRRQLRQA